MTVTETRKLLAELITQAARLALSDVSNRAKHQAIASALKRLQNHGEKRREFGERAFDNNRVDK